MAGTKGRSGGARNGAGRKAFSPTPEHRSIVELATAFGFTQEQTRQLITNPTTKEPLGKDALHRYFQPELDRGYAKAVAAVGNALFQNAVKHNNVSAQIFFLKTRAKAQWSEAPLNINAAVTHDGVGLGDIGEQLVSAIARLRFDGSADESGDSEPHRGTTH